MEIDVEWREGLKTNIIYLQHINTEGAGKKGKGLAKALISLIGETAPFDSIIAFSPPAYASEVISHLVKSEITSDA